jgi:hypothetical protein
MSGVHARLFISAVLATLGGLAVSACGSSVNTATAPSSLSRCAVTLNGGGTLPAQGGTSTIGVSAARECSWSASTEGTWLSIRSGGSGQGDGAVEFSAAPNPDPAVRQGAVVLNDQRFNVTQAAGECSFSLAQGSAAFPVAGGSGQVDLRASSSLCTWSADADADWIAVRTRQGTGSALVPFDIAPLAGGAPRTGLIRIAGLQFAVAQSSGGCAFTITPASHAAGTDGGSGSISIATAPGCSWTAASGVSWLTFSPAAGSGPGSVAFTIAPSGGATRSATATVAGQPFTVTQSGAGGSACSYAVQPLSHAVPPAGGTVSVAVTTGETCPWSVSSTLSWVAVSDSWSYTGSGTARFAVSPTAGAVRTGTVTVAGQLVTITQTAECTYSVSPTAHTLPAEGGSGSVAVVAGAGCAWTATSQADWITVTGGSSGSGTGSVLFQAAPLSSGSRTGTMTVADQIVTVTQTAAPAPPAPPAPPPACTPGIAPQSRNVEASGGTVSVNVTAASGCAWTAASNEPWIAVAPQAGTGNASVAVHVQANDGPARTGTVTIGERTFTVNQAAAPPAPACTYQVQPTSIDRNWRPWEIELTVTTTAGCTWTAQTTATWLTISSGATGTGSGTVVLEMAENSGPTRQATVTIGGQTVELTQRGRN